LRIGYLVLPPALVDVFVRVRTAISRQPPGVDQAVLADFIAGGHLDRYLRTVVRTYRERQQALIGALKSMHPMSWSHRYTALECIWWLG
jgi:GntR family transcriptional regulator / MocR family aminotransferase